MDFPLYEFLSSVCPTDRRGGTGLGIVFDRVAVHVSRRRLPLEEAIAMALKFCRRCRREDVEWLFSEFYRSEIYGLPRPRPLKVPLRCGYVTIQPDFARLEVAYEVKTRRADIRDALQAAIYTLKYHTVVLYVFDVERREVYSDVYNRFALEEKLGPLYREALEALDEYSCGRIRRIC